MRNVMKAATPPDFYDYLDKFFMKLQNEGEMVKSPQDAMSHFARWLNIELKKRTNNESKSTFFYSIFFVLWESSFSFIGN